MCIFMTVDYNEDNPLEYRGVVLKFGSKEIFRSNEGFVKDYNRASAYADENYPSLPLMLSSSVDHYAHDADISWEEV